MPNITDFNKPYELNRSTLKTQQKLNNRSKEAMIQRDNTPEILPTKQDVKLLVLYDDNPEAIADKHRKATSIEIQLANISKNAIIDELGWKPSKIKSEVTQQMIDEYRAEMNQPVKVVDPDTGKEVVYRYKPSSVDLTPFKAQLDAELSDADLANIDQEIVKRIKLINEANLFLINSHSRAQKIDEEYNHERAIYQRLDYIPKIDFNQTRQQIYDAQNFEQLNKIAKILNVSINTGVSVDPTTNLRKKKAILINRADELETERDELEKLPDPGIKWNQQLQDLSYEIEQRVEKVKQYEFEIERLKNTVKEDKLVKMKLNKQKPIN